ncbi:hypothetical protein [Psychromonas sp.]|uniref:hypothetical protein n=1 Tax=Psychromonas sp. TaxID=1884585 RepID=UPI003A96B075
MKRVLIYGEYSGYGKSLSQGFRDLGHHSSVFSPTGDNWKEISVNYCLDNRSKISKLLSLAKLIPKFLRYDVVYIMNPYFFSVSLLGPLVLLLFWLFNKKVFLLCCGADVEYIKTGEAGELNRWVYNGVGLPSPSFYKRKRDIFVNYLCAKVSRKIIPVMYDYQFCWKQSAFSHKLSNVVPLACDGQVTSIKSTDVNKIVIMHGISRAELKGSDVIIDALNYINVKYDNVEVLFPERLSQKEYLDLFEKVDISIDQCKSNSYGMNGVYALLQGHVLLSSCSKEFHDSLSIEEIPVIHIEEDVSDIISKLESILLNPEELKNIKKSSQNYASYLHNPKRVANKLEEIELSCQ